VILEERAYQDEATALAIASIEAHGGFALFMEQRTGKTPVAARVIQHFRPERLLITCPEIAIEVWKAHIPEDFTGELRIVTRDSLWRERKRLKHWKPDLAIADEGHDFKGKTSKRSRALRIIGRVSARRLLLTGTPQESGLEDYWPQIEFVVPGLLGEWSEFQDWYLVMGGFRGKKIVGYKNQERFRKLIAPVSYRVLLEDVQKVKTRIAPPKVVRFDLTESREPYRRMEEDLVAEVNQTVMARALAPDGTVTFRPRRKRIVAPRAITQAMKLHQIAGGFLIDSSGSVHRFGYEKLEQAGALMLALGDVPQVYFCRFIPEAYRLGQLFKLLDRDVTYIAGKSSMKLLAPEQPAYVSGSPFDIAVVQVRSGVAIDLAHAEEAIFYSWDYSYLTYDQARFRIRSYHGRRARYHYLVARETVDEQLLEVVLHKASFAKLIIDKYRRQHGREKKGS
jgi:hypothetical protein